MLTATSLELQGILGINKGKVHLKVSSELRLHMWCWILYLSISVFGCVYTERSSGLERDGLVMCDLTSCRQLMKQQCHVSDIVGTVQSKESEQWLVLIPAPHTQPVDRVSIHWKLAQWHFGGAFGIALETEKLEKREGEMMEAGWRPSRGWSHTHTHIQSVSTNTAFAKGQMEKN